MWNLTLTRIWMNKIMMRCMIPYNVAMQPTLILPCQGLLLRKLSLQCIARILPIMQSLILINYNSPVNTNLEPRFVPVARCACLRDTAMNWEINFCHMLEYQNMVSWSAVISANPTLIPHLSLVELTLTTASEKEHLPPSNHMAEFQLDILKRVRVNSSKTKKNPIRIT